MKSGRFDEESAKRIGAAVKKVEQMPTPINGAGGGPRLSGEGFFAKITAVNSETGYYAWTMQTPKAPGDSGSNAGVQDLSGAALAKGTMGTTTVGYAKEVNGRKDIAKDSIVWLTGDGPPVPRDRFAGTRAGRA